MCDRGSGKFRYSVRNKKTDITKKKRKKYVDTTVDTIFSIFGVDNIIKFFLFFFPAAYNIRLKRYIPRFISYVLLNRII